MEGRLERLEQLMTQRGVEAVALIPGANLYYLTGLQMHTSERVTLALFLRGGKGILLLPALEAFRAKARTRTPMTLFPWSDAEGPAAAWDRLKREYDLAGKIIAVEFLNMRVMELDQLTTFAPGVSLRDASELLAELRMAKDPEEIDAMRRAARVIDTSLERVLGLLKPGMTERQIARQWQLSMAECGADSIPEEPIVAAGPNSAAPHITSSDRRLARGDLVIFDGWCQVDGYFTDITRTLAVGDVAPELKRIYEVVKEANEAAFKAVTPGRQCQEIDRAAREVIDRAGYGEYFLHRTGHGLGLEVHEPPSIVQGNSLALRTRMTFTDEPGIYLAGQGGVRIEDDILVTQDGGERLTNYSRELQVV